MYADFKEKRIKDEIDTIFASFLLKKNTDVLDKLIPKLLSMAIVSDFCLDIKFY